MSSFIENVLDKDLLLREPNDYLYAQRTMRHKVRIFYEELKDLYIDLENSSTGICLSQENYENNIYENMDFSDDKSNSNNATNFYQLFSEETYAQDITYANYLYLDGTVKFDDPMNGPPLLMSRYYNETVEKVGWMSRTLCEENGFFLNPVRLVYTFKSNHTISRWLIRSVANEIPEDFSLCVYNEEGDMIYKKIVNGNTDNTYGVDIDRGLCRKIEMRITKWAVKDTKTGTLSYKKACAKIVYFYHDAMFPEGATDYASNDLLQSFSANEYLCSSIGKANYGVQSNTGQFTLINNRRLFDTLKHAGFLKNGLKVEYFVAVENYFTPAITNGYVDEEKCKQGIEIGEENKTDNGPKGLSPPKKLPDEKWELLATHYITDIEFDEVKDLVKFRTQDRLIKFQDIKYSGYKKVVSNKLRPIEKDDLIKDIINQAEMKLLEEYETYSPDNPENTLPLPPLGVGNEKLYEITTDAAKALANRKIERGYLDEMSVWSAMQNSCNLDLMHVYIARDDKLVIDKISQL